MKFFICPRMRTENDSETFSTERHENWMWRGEESMEILRSLRWKISAIFKKILAHTRVLLHSRELYDITKYVFTRSLCYCASLIIENEDFYGDDEKSTK